MRKIALTLVAVAGVCLALASCNREIKPSTKGCFLVKSKKLIELPAVSLETVFTAEGFALNYFNGEPAATLRPDDYIILYGDYKPTSLKAYRNQSGYYQEDSSKPAASDAITVGPMKGEKEMFKCRFAKPLPPGVYLLECQSGKGTVGFPFAVD
jgi:hypothetical protein